MYNITIQQNEPQADFIDYLRSQNFFIEMASAEEVVKGSTDKTFDVAVVERLEVIKEIRLNNPKVAVIYMPNVRMYTDEEAIAGLQAGADMCIFKPYSLRYVVACIKAVLARSGVQAQPNTYYINAYTFIPKERLLILGDLEQKLTLKECEVLKLLCEYKDTLLPRDLALRTLWKDANYFNARSLDTHITSLRKRFAYDKRIKIQNVRNKGFVLSTE